jgi:hypothetical protein
LCQLQDRETQKRAARDLQKPAPQAKTRMTASTLHPFNALTVVVEAIKR